MIKNTASQTIGEQMVDASTGGAFTGTVTIYVTGDAGTQAIGSVGSGLCTHEGNGYHTYRPSQAETNYDLIAFTFIGSGAIPRTVQVATLSAAQSSALHSATGASVRYVLDLIEAALAGHNVYASGEPLKPADAQLVLYHLNLILSDWTADLQASYASVFLEVVTTGANPQTIGPSGDWVVTTRPVALQGVSVDFGTGYTPIDATNDPAWWQAQTPASSGLAVSAFYSADEPNGSLYFRDAPASGTLVRLQLRTTFDVVALPDVLVLPPGYESALLYTLQEAIAESFHATVSPRLERAAGKARARIFGNNLRVPSLSAAGLGLPGDTGGYFDFYTRTWR
jgi:hypothetical protein